jgi:hypothetical protein
MTQLPATTPQLPSADPSAFDQVMQRMVGSISDSEIGKARLKVATMRSRRPGASDDAIANALIRQKCIETGVVAVLASAPALIPGIGSAIAVTAGLMVDVQKTVQMQKDLIIELATVYDHDLTELDRRNLLVLIAGVDSGNKFAAKAGSELAAKATAKLATEAGSRLLVKAIPFAGIATSAGINLVSTYLVGRRAQAYLKMDPSATEDWRESARALSGVDERQLAGWLSEALHEAGLWLRGPAQLVGNAVGGAGTFVQAQAGRLASMLPRPGKNRQP